MQTSWLCFTEAELWPIEVLHYAFSTFFAPVNLTLTRWSWPVFPGDIQDV